MNNLFIIPILCTTIFCLAKFLERSISKNENDEDGNNDKFSVKIIIRDSIVVFTSTLLANFIDSHIHSYLDTLFNVITETKSFPSVTNTEIFTDMPNF